MMCQRFLSFINSIRIRWLSSPSTPSKRQGLGSINTRPRTIQVKGSFFLYSLRIHTLTFIAFITQKQEQTFLFLEFKALSFISYNLYLKLLILWSEGIQILSKRDFF